jgi:hypothetical protein
MKHPDQLDKSVGIASLSTIFKYTGDGGAFYSRGKARESGRSRAETELDGLWRTDPLDRRLTL